MAKYTTILTTLGASKIAAALAASSSVTLQAIAVGDGNGSAVTPNASQTGLVHEVYRQNLNSLTPDPNFSNVVIAEITIPGTVGGWTVREIGLIDTSGSFIAVGNFPDTVKSVSTDGSAQTLVVKMYLQVASDSAVSLTIDPSTVIATRSWMLGLLYPVGEVLITHRTGSPDTWLGIGTWQRYGAGRMLAFYDPSQAEFNAVDNVGGAKTVTLATANLPSHSHHINFSTVTAASGNHTHNVTAGGNTGNSGTHVHGLSQAIASTPGSPLGTGVAQAGFDASAYKNAGGVTTDAGGDHTHTVYVTGSTDSQGGHQHTVLIAGDTDQTGNGSAFSILPPYTTLFAWLRIA